MRAWLTVICVAAALTGCETSGGATDSGMSPGDSGGLPVDSGMTEETDASVPPVDSGTPPSDAGPPSAFAAAYTVLRTRCAGCHTGPGTSGGLAFGSSAETAYAALVGPNRSAAGACSGPTELVTPGDPAASFLFVKVQGAPAAGCGARMPLGGALSPTDLETIRAWIAAGAEGP